MLVIPVHSLIYYLCCSEYTIMAKVAFKKKKKKERSEQNKTWCCDQNNFRGLISK